MSKVKWFLDLFLIKITKIITIISIQKTFLIKSKMVYYDRTDVSKAHLRNVLFVTSGKY